MGGSDDGVLDGACQAQRWEERAVGGTRRRSLGRKGDRHSCSVGGRRSGDCALRRRLAPVAHPCGRHDSCRRLPLAPGHFEAVGASHIRPGLEESAAHRAQLARRGPEGGFTTHADPPLGTACFTLGGRAPRSRSRLTTRPPGACGGRRPGFVRREGGGQGGVDDRPLGDGLPSAAYDIRAGGSARTQRRSGAGRSASGSGRQGHRALSRAMPALGSAAR